MNSRVRPSFWRSYADLDPRIRDAAKRAYALFVENPAHPSLRFKKLTGYEDVWSVRINEQYRAVGQRNGEVVIWGWIGFHNDFDKLLGQQIQ